MPSKPNKILIKYTSNKTFRLSDDVKVNKPANANHNICQNLVDI
jgi:hypothetical protein